MADLVALHDEVLALLRAEPRFGHTLTDPTVFDGAVQHDNGVPTHAPVDDAGSVRPHVILLATPGIPPMRTLAGDPVGLDWQFSIFAVGAHPYGTLFAIQTARDVLDGAWLGSNTGRCSDRTLPTDLIQDTLTDPTRWYGTLRFHVISS